MKNLTEQLAEIKSREYDKEKICSCGTDIPKLLAVIEKLLEQREECASDDHDSRSWEKCAVNYDSELAKILEGAE